MKILLCINRRLICHCCYCWLFDLLTLDCDVQVSQLGAAAQKYQTAIQNASSNLSTSELQNNCNM